MLNTAPQSNPAMPVFGFIYRPEATDVPTLGLDELGETGDFSTQLRALLLSHYQQQNLSEDMHDIDVNELKSLVKDLPFDFDLSGEQDVFQQLSSWLAEQGLASEWSPRKSDNQIDGMNLLAGATKSFELDGNVVQTEGQLELDARLERLIHDQGLMDVKSANRASDQRAVNVAELEQKQAIADKRLEESALLSAQENLSLKSKPLAEALQKLFDAQTFVRTDGEADNLATDLTLPLAAVNDETLARELSVVWAEPQVASAEEDLTPEQQAAINLLNVGATHETPLEAGLATVLNSSVAELELGEEALLAQEDQELSLLVSPVPQSSQAAAQTVAGSSAAAVIQPNIARQVQPAQPAADKLNMNVSQTGQLLGQVTPAESVSKSLQETFSALLSNAQNQATSLPQQAITLTTRELLAQQQQEALRASESKFNAAAQGDAESELLNTTGSASERKAGAPSLASISYPLRHPQWAQSVGKRIVFMANQQMQQAQISLNPEKLGPIQLRLQLDRDQMMTVSMTAQHGTTREALEAAIPRLKEMLESAGIAFDEVKVEDEALFEQSGQQSNPEQSKHGQATNAEDGLETEVSAKINTENMIDFYA